MAGPMEQSLSKSLQRGEDPQFDQLLSAFAQVAEHCLPSILRTLFDWYERQGVEWVITDYKVGKGDSKGKSELSLARSEYEFVSEKRDLAVEFIFCLVLVEVLKQLSLSYDIVFTQSFKLFLNFAQFWRVFEILKLSVK